MSPSPSFGVAVLNPWPHFRKKYHTMSINISETEVEILIKIPLQPFLKIIEDNAKRVAQESTQREVIMCGKEAAATLLISKSSLMRWVKLGKIPYIKRGHRYYFKKSTIDGLNVEIKLKGISRIG